MSLWNLSDGRLLSEFEGISREMVCVVVNHTGRQLIVGDCDGYLVVLLFVDRGVFLVLLIAL